MRNFLIPLAVLSLSLGGCSASHEPGTAEMSVQEAAPAVPAKDGADAANAEPLTVDDAAKATQAGEQAPRAPQIAYTYTYGFRITGEAIAPLQRRHADLCERKGPQVCRIIAMSNSGGEGDYGSGTLELDVAADKARAFTGELESIAKDANGKPVSAAIAGEDLSKQIVDTQARLRARILLRDRLMEILQTRKGSVAELVEAERGVAQVNEEIDQAQSWLAEKRGQVDFSRVTVNYSSAAPGAGGFMSPIRSALGSLGAILGAVIAGLIVVLTALIPIAALLVAILWAVRRIRRFRAASGSAITAGETTDPQAGPDNP